MESKDYWTQYWQQGHQTSFGSSFKGNYQGKLRQQWQEVFNDLASNQQVLDLCTGNGTLIRLAKELMTDFDAVEFTGVDYAKIIVDQEFSQLANINLVEQVNIEKLPLADHSVDLVVSNFGIEYSKLDKSLVELVRVLKQQGKFELICHHQQSKFIKDSRRCLDMLVKINAPEGVIATLRALIKALANKQSSQAEVYRHQLNTQLSELFQQDEKALNDSDFLSFLKYVLSSQAENKLASLAEYEKESIGFKARLEAMTTAALTKQDIEFITSYCQQHGIKNLSVDEVSEHEELLFYRLSGTKA